MFVVVDYVRRSYGFYGCVFGYGRMSSPSAQKPGGVGILIVLKRRLGALRLPCGDDLTR